MGGKYKKSIKKGVGMFKADVTTQQVINRAAKKSRVLKAKSRLVMERKKTLGA